MAPTLAAEFGADVLRRPSPSTVVGRPTGATRACPVAPCRRRWLAAALVLAGGAAAGAEADVDLRGQATYAWQAKPAFASRYEGVHSLGAARALSYSFTGTASLGLHLAGGTDLRADVELVQGVAFSELGGLGGPTNGELQKTAGPTPTVYRARLYGRREWTMDADRIVLTAGNFAVGDVFDLNPLAHDARTQFMNWALLTHGAYDYAADARGYTWGAAVEWSRGDWTARAGRFAMPRESNGLKLDGQFMRQHGDQIEVEHRHRVGGQAGALRALVWRNVARFGRFDEALAATGGSAPSLDGVRRRQAKSGWGLSAEQRFGADLGGFARVAASDGRAEPYAFTSIDQSCAAGLVLAGASWSRPRDSIGLAWTWNGLSDAHRRYLAAGGSDFFLGDGALTYARERMVEAYAAFALNTALTFSLDLQQVRAPGYNADRGPARFFGARLHAEF